LKLGTISFDAVRPLMLCRIGRRPPRLDMENYPHLALAQIPKSMNGSARNFHFEDYLENGELAFDFKLKPGVVQTSNALKLMQAIGLVAPQPVS
jgi:hypothetical protein